MKPHPRLTTVMRTAAILLFLLAALPVAATSAADEPIWTDVGVQLRGEGPPPIVATQYRTLQANVGALRSVLASAPSEETVPVGASPLILSLPMPDGTFQRFQVVESPIMAPELAARYPEITTYLGQGIDDPTATTRLDWTPFGFHAIILSSQDAVYIDPLIGGNVEYYMSYYERNYVPGPLEQFFEPTLPEAELAAAAEAAAARPTAVLKPSGTQLRTYRLALAATGEYTQFYGGTVALALAGMTTTMNRVTGIYEREVAIRMVMIANTDQLIYTDGSTDPYTNNDGGAMLGENQANVDSVIGDANYDIGHVFSTGGGGIASLGVPCRSGVKARGVTGSGAPQGDPFDVDYVAHEMGHQFGGNHNFNGQTGSCGGGNRNASTAYEPGSGSTIMAYAGICGTDDLQPHSDPYFHTVSFDEIVAYSTAGAGNNCPVVTATGNNPPNVPAGTGGFNIPRDTPFVMTGSATDPDGDVLTYCWEEFDLASSAGPPPPVAGYVVPPFFRSFNPTASGSRIFPKLDSIVNNTTSLGEILPTGTRTLNFRLTVRDNRAGGGGVNYAAFAVSSVLEAGPFRVTAPNTAVTWYAGGTADVTWDVANTLVAPVNCASVDIGLSTDGGYTYPTTLAAATPNDGAQQVNVPVMVSTTARVRVQCATNIFFDISDANFQIAPTADLSITKSDDPDPVNAGANLRYAITVSNAGPFAAENVSVTDVLPAGVTYLTNTDTCSEGPTGTLTCNLGSIPAGAVRSFEIMVQVDADLVANAGGPVELTNSATVTSTTMDLDLTDNTDVEGTIVKDEADLQVFKDCKPDEPLPAGGSGLCIISIRNWGPSDARNVTLTDVHISQPGYFNLTPGSGALGCIFPGNPVATKGTITCDLGNLAAGDELEVMVGVSTDQELDIDDTATVTAATPDPETANNSASDRLTFIAAADLALTKTATPSPVIAGTNLTYDLTVTNNGPSTALNVVIKDVLPAGVSIVSVSAPGGTCNAGIPGNAAVPTTCTFDTMVKNAVKTMQVVVKVDPSFLGVLGNNAEVSAETYDPNNDNNLATTATTVEGSADLSVTKSDSPDPVSAGNMLTYDVTITNNGPSTAVDVALTDVLSAWVAFQGYQVSNGTGTCSLLPGSTTDLSCDLNDLLPGQFVRVVFTVLVNPSTPDGTVITNAATVSAATPDPNAANNTATADTTVVARADLSISKDARADYTNPAPRVVYTIVVTNLGPSDAQNVTMTDPLPLTAKKLVFLYYNGVGPAAGACTYTGTKTTHTFSCSFGTLAAGESRTVDVWLDARGSVGTIINTASTTSTTVDPNTANNSARKDIKIKGGPGPK